MDPISGVASVIALVQIAQVIAGSLKSYYKGVKEARDDIKSLYASIILLETVLDHTQKLEDNPQATPLITLLHEPNGLLSQISTDLNQLHNLLGKPKPLVSVKQSLGWPFQKKDIVKIVSKLEDHKLTLSTMIGLQGLYVYDAQNGI
jgi:hypothetical protein